MQEQLYQAIISKSIVDHFGNMRAFLLLITVWINWSCAKVVPIIYEDYELCVEPEKRAGKFDFSELEIYAESDTNVVLNGTWTFLKEVKSPWTSIVYTERFDRGQWNTELMHSKIPDFCADIQNPTKPWYFITSKYEPKYCPFPAGVRNLIRIVIVTMTTLNFFQTKINFNMQPLVEIPFVPPNYIGKWRVTMMGEFADEDGKQECMRIYLDLVEE